MKTVSVTEFRNNMKRYLDIAQKEKLVIHRASGNSYAIVPLKEIEDIGYNPEFVAKIMKSRQDSIGGKVTFIKTEDLWK